MIQVTIETDIDSYPIYTTMEPGVWSYKAIVSTLVRIRYFQDTVEAILSNALLLMTNPSSISDEEINDKQKEFSDFQEWREKCKAKAKELIELGKEKGLVET